MLTVKFVLVLGATILVLFSAAGKVPLWPAVFVIAVIELLDQLPWSK